MAVADEGAARQARPSSQATIPTTYSAPTR